MVDRVVGFGNSKGTDGSQLLNKHGDSNKIAGD